MIFSFCPTGSLKCSSVAADNDNQTSVFENCDQGPCSVETNIIAGVNEVIVCFFLIIISYYDD